MTEVQVAVTPSLNVPGAETLPASSSVVPSADSVKTSSVQVWVSAQIWHPNQKTSWEKSGSYVLEIPYANDRELLMEILKFGADVEVLGPARLRDRVSEALAEALTRYAGS